MENYLYIILMLLGAFAIRIEMLLSRSGIENDNILTNIVSGISTISFYSLIVYGFIYLIWWHTIIIIITTSFIGLIINNQTFSLFFTLLKLFQTLVIVGTLILWFNY